MQSPFLTNPTSSGGKLYFDLGSVSEDVLRDGRRFFENGLNTPNIPAAIDSTTVWGRAPSTRYRLPMHLATILPTDLTRMSVSTVWMMPENKPNSKITWHNWRRCLEPVPRFDQKMH